MAETKTRGQRPESAVIDEAGEAAFAAAVTAGSALAVADKEPPGLVEYDEPKRGAARVSAPAPPPPSTKYAPGVFLVALAPDHKPKLVKAESEHSAWVKYQAWYGIISTPLKPTVQRARLKEGQAPHIE